jgi:hypothetical protein
MWFGLVLMGHLCLIIIIIIKHLFGPHEHGRTGKLPMGIQQRDIKQPNIGAD